jgi:hypothetical protein
MMSFPWAELYRQGVAGWGTIVRAGAAIGCGLSPPTGLDTPAIAQVQADARRRIPRAFARRF